MRTTDGEKGMTMWRKLSENYTHPLSLSMPRPCNATSDQNPISYALTFVRGKADAPQDLLCTAEVLHQIEYWVLNCQLLEEVAQANGLTAVRKPFTPYDEFTDEGQFEILCKELHAQNEEFLRIRFEYDLASQLRESIKAGAGACDVRTLTVLRLRLSSLPVQLFKRAASEASSGFCSQEAGSEDISQPFKSGELAKRLSQLGEGPVPSRPMLHLLMAVRFRYMGSVFDGPLFLTERSYERDLAEIGKSICQGQMLWMVPLFLPHWFPFSHDVALRSKVLLKEAIMSKSLPAFRAFYEDRRSGVGYDFDKYNAATLAQMTILVELAKGYGVPWSCPAYSDGDSASHDQIMRQGYDDLISDAPLPTQIWGLQKLHTRRALFRPEGKFHEEALGVRAALRKWNAAQGKHSLLHEPRRSLPRQGSKQHEQDVIHADVSAFARVIDLRDVTWHLPATILDAYKGDSCVLPFTDTKFFSMPQDLSFYRGTPALDKQGLLSLAVQKQVYDIAAYLVGKGVAPDFNAIRYLEGNSDV